MNKKDKRKLIWGFGLLILGFIMMYIVIETTIAGEMIKSSSILGPIGLFTSLPAILTSPFGILAFFMILFGMGLLIKLSIEKLKKFFGI